MSSQNPSDQVPEYGQYVPPTDQHGAPGAQHGQPGQPAPQGQYPPPGHPGGSATPLSPADTKTWASLSHLLGGILGFLAPLVIWLVFRERSHAVEAEAKKALNFQIPVALVLLAANLVLPGFLSGLVVFGVWVTSLVFGIIAFQAVSNGRPSSYPIDVKIVR